MFLCQVTYNSNNSSYQYQLLAYGNPQILGKLVLAKGDKRQVMQSKVSNKFCNITSPLTVQQYQILETAGYFYKRRIRDQICTRILILTVSTLVCRREKGYVPTLGRRTYVLGGFQRESLEDHYYQLVKMESIKLIDCKAGL